MTLSLNREIIYPDSDGQPMADNTEQFRWIVLFKENLECLFADDPDVFVAGDLLWYPVEGRPDIRVAPDVFVAIGRSKGYRGSYRQWQEDNIAPQVVFEILSPGNRSKDMIRKLKFYEHYGVEEYYLYDPENNDLTVLQRQDGELRVIEDRDDWTSPRLGIRFVVTPETLEVYYPDGRRFLTTVELARQAEREKERAEREKERADRLAERLRSLGIDPEEI
ncbi:Uma2 family endonuclease [Pannus brasiliensis CCIBt3594]|uniref:Uma2 family endonuclease n=1 Tax=Pannus brasiliensis CCIBt3594 TaxID=1427578 RepID=A0AAW9QNI8_9CHRO